MLNPVLISVVTVIVLSLLRLNVLLSLIIGGLVGGLLAGMSVEGVMTTLVEGMGGNAATALDYILLGALAAAISQSGVATLLAHHLAKKIGQHTTWLILGIALFSMLSQNVIPVHIAFIPILIPPLLPVFNMLKIDRRAIDCIGLNLWLADPLYINSDWVRLNFSQYYKRGIDGKWSVGDQ